MNENTGTKAGRDIEKASKKDARQARITANMRDNMKRRKSQERARVAQDDKSK